MSGREGRRLGAALMGALALSMGVRAAAFVACTGPVTLLALAPQSGVVTTSIGSYGPWAICSISTTSNGVSPDACKALYAQLNIALSTSRRLAFDFDDGSPSWTQDTPWCTALGSWTVPNPYPYLVTLVDY